MASVNLAPPVCLAASLGEVPAGGGARPINITIGLFAIIQLARPVPLMIPSYEYCMPAKECSTNTDSPCELFDKMSFPASEFFPQALDPCAISCNEQQATEPETAPAPTNGSRPSGTPRG